MFVVSKHLVIYSLNPLRLHLNDRIVLNNTNIDQCSEHGVQQNNDVKFIHVCSQYK